MRTTWRERIEEARKRGFFTADDKWTWASTTTCPAGEAVRAYGLRATSGFYHPVLHPIGDAMWDMIETNNFGGADRLLDAIEDQALKLKREMTDQRP